MTATMEHIEVTCANGEPVRVPLSAAVDLAPSTAQEAPAADGPAAAPAPAPVPQPPLPKWRRNLNSWVGAVLMVPGLGMSGWSMYSYVRTSTNAPMVIAAGASTAFDGIALFAALMAHEAVQRGRRSKLGRALVYLSVTASTVINWEHASTEHYPLGIHLMLAAPALIAAGGFELILEKTRADEREKRDPRRRTKQAAKVDLDLYIRHPYLVWKCRQNEGKTRLREVFPPVADKNESFGGKSRRTRNMPDRTVNSAADGRTAVLTARVTDRPTDPRTADRGRTDRTASQRTDGPTRTDRTADGPADRTVGSRTDGPDRERTDRRADGPTDRTADRGPRTDGPDREPADGRTDADGPDRGRTDGPTDRTVDGPDHGRTDEADQDRTGLRTPIHPRPRPRVAGSGQVVELTDQDRTDIAAVARQMQASDVPITRSNLRDWMTQADVRCGANQRMILALAHAKQTVGHP